MREVRGRPAVEVEHRVELLRRQLEEGRDRRQRGVAHQKTNVLGRPGNGVDTNGCAHIRDQDPGVDAVGGAQPLGQIVEQGLPPGDEHDVEPAFGEGVREGGADPVRGPDDHGPRTVPVSHAERRP